MTVLFASERFNMAISFCSIIINGQHIAHSKVFIKFHKQSTEPGVCFVLKGKSKLYLYSWQGKRLQDSMFLHWQTPFILLVATVVFLMKEKI